MSASFWPHKVRRYPFRSLGPNLLWGISNGLVMGGVYCLIGALLRLLRGPHLLDPYGMTFGALELAYLSSGLVAGFLAGVARPVLRWRAGALAVGAVGGVFAYGALQAGILGPPTRWDVFDVVSWLLVGAVGGAYFANGMWERLVEPNLPPPPLPPGPPPRRRPLGLWKP